MTDGERLLWSQLRRKQIAGVQFYRQKPIGKYIVDFYAPKVRLVVEIDGSQHFTAENVARDAERDACLSRLGLQVLRFDNLQILKETGAVLEIILQVVTERLSAGNYRVREPTAQNPPCPPFSKGGKEGATSPLKAMQMQFHPLKMIQRQFSPLKMIRMQSPHLKMMQM